MVSAWRRFVYSVYKDLRIMLLQLGVLLVAIGEFSRFRTSWHTIGTLDWSHVVCPTFSAIETPPPVRGEQMAHEVALTTCFGRFR